MTTGERCGAKRGRPDHPAARWPAGTGEGGATRGAPLGEVIVELLPVGGRGTESFVSLPATDEGPGGQTLTEDRQTLARPTAAPRERDGWIAADAGATSGAAARRWVTVAPADAAKPRVRIGEMVRGVTF